MHCQLESITNSSNQNKPEHHPQTYQNMKLKTCKHCENQFAPKSGRQDYCNQKCKTAFYRAIPKPHAMINCTVCNAPFHSSGSTNKYCSSDCHTAYLKLKAYPERANRRCPCCDTDMSRMNLAKKYCSTKCNRQHRSELKYTGTEGIDYVTCPLCQLRTRQYTPDHAKMHGYTNINEFASDNGITKLTCDAKCKNASGENNFMFNHGGKYSPMSKNFIHGYDEDWHKQHVTNHKVFLKNNKHLFKSNLEYWLTQTDNEEEARKLHSTFQGKTLQSFIATYGEEEGTKRHRAKTEKWMKSYKKTNFSAISQELFHALCPFLDTSLVYFATFDRPEKIGYVNKEYVLVLSTTTIRPDFIDLSSKRIIEFDGDYWHSSNVTANPEREKNRDDAIISNGYSVLHITENSYKKNKEATIQQCITFLTA